ncbi:thiol reductant ABC exporter subunit CydC [Rossellomorea marisflavi]|uniref:thiol reductant ABC exporter subunit CydC n=1 Tax=Rossellomorea marisflavi TaxID=189381 RepID=UPI0020797D70|nr:thiol reductant ABC exporter subunit CydC [Rossellomorea marisflavi]USK93642.1 thiol reductant ABC exporter subunit CydC [Rossellomorea marisflavi]
MRELTEIIRLTLKEKKDVVLSAVFGAVAGLTSVGVFALSGYMISQAALEVPLYVLTIMIALMKLLGILKAVTRYAERYYSHRATFTILANLRASIFERLETIAPTIFQRYKSGDLLARIVGDVESLQNFFLRVFYPPLVMVIVFMATILFTLFYSMPTGILLIVGVLLTGFLIPSMVTLKQRKIESRVRDSRSELSAGTTEFLYGFRELKIHQQLSHQEEALGGASSTYVEEQDLESRHSLFSHTINLLVSLLITWFVLVVGVYAVGEGTLDGVLLAMLVMISLTVFDEAIPMATLPYHLEDSRKASKRLGEIRGAELKERRSEEAPDHAPSFRMEKVGFTFEGGERPSISGVDLYIPEGSKTAVIGASGSGKSTLLNLLLTFHTPDEGQILLDSHPLDAIKQESLWQRAAVILQENHFFHGSIRDNLLIAGEVDDEELERVLSKVKLPFGLEDTVTEKGGNLSGGEKQRMAIARAILKGGPLWIMDEPTSSIDPMLEAELMDVILQEAEHSTLLLISHRLTGLEEMDQIVVMEEGKIAEIGNYRELMDQKGYFYHMKEIEKNVIFQ